MREKLGNIVAFRLTDSDLVRLTALLKKVEGEQVLPVRLTLAGVCQAIVLRELAAFDKSVSFPAHSPPAGKMERRARGSGKASNVIKLKQSA